MASKKSQNESNGGFATEGIWYYVYLRPDWHLMYDLDPNASHLQFWRKTVAPMLMDWYKLDDSARVKLSELSTSMPRGRVLLNERRYGIYHGDDFPKGLSRDGELKKIVSAFGLSRYYILKRVDVCFEPHECMDKKQQTALRKLLGKIPY
jgi:hypothetical protein